MIDNFPSRLQTLLPLFEQAGLRRNELTQNEIDTYVFHLLNARKPSENCISQTEYISILQKYKRLIALTYEIKGRYFGPSKRDGEDILTQSMMLGWSLYPVIVHKILFLTRLYQMLIAHL